MNLDDFCYARQGKMISGLDYSESNCIAAIDHRSGKTKRALLLLHGFASTPAVYREILSELNQQYDAVVCPALPGHGENLIAFEHASALEWLACAERTARQLITEYQSVDILGLSLGGLLAWQLSQQLSFNRLYLLAPALALKRNGHQLLNLAKVLHWLGFRYLRNKAGNIRHKTFCELTYRLLPLAAIVEVLMLTQTVDTSLSPLCPVDVFLGRYDVVIDSLRVEQIASRWPNTAIHWLEHSAHILPLDNDRDAIIACIKQRNTMVS